MSFDTSLLYYSFLLISTCIILLSLTGKTLGIRMICAKFLLEVFEWASHLQSQELDDDEDVETDDNDAELPVEFPPVEQDSNPPPVRKRKKRVMSGNRPLITRQWSSTIDRKLHSDVDTDTETESNAGDLILPKSHTVDVIVNDMLEFVSAGVESIIEDQVTSRFKAAQLASWNLLSRSKSYVHISWKLNLIWILGVVFRYSVLLPVRFFVFLVGLGVLFVCSLVIGVVPSESVRISLNRYAMLMFFRIMSRASASIITFHDIENRPNSGIVVANHTSPIDVMVLSCDNCYAMIGQRHGGVLGMIQQAVSRCSHHIWFERTQAKDRNTVRRALQEHVDDPKKLPVLIFPEGTCINNTSVMMFKKGSFECSDIVYPVALKYDNRLGDAFWNSAEQGYFSYILSILTSWALICDVYYLPPVSRNEDETPVEFARRVKRLIAKKGGLVDLEWDGNLKRSAVPDRLKDAQKELFFQYLTRTTTIGEYNVDELANIRHLSMKVSPSPA